MKLDNPKLIITYDKQHDVVNPNYYLVKGTQEYQEGSKTVQREVYFGCSKRSEDPIDVLFTPFCRQEDAQKMIDSLIYLQRFVPDERNLRVEAQTAFGGTFLRKIDLKEDDIKHPFIAWEILQLTDIFYKFTDEYHMFEDKLLRHLLSSWMKRNDVFVSNLTEPRHQSIEACHQVAVLMNMTESLVDSEYSISEQIGRLNEAKTKLNKMEAELRKRIPEIARARTNTVKSLRSCAPALREKYKEQLVRVNKKLAAANHALLKLENIGSSANSVSSK